MSTFKSGTNHPVQRSAFRDSNAATTICGRLIPELMSSIDRKIGSNPYVSTDSLKELLGISRGLRQILILLSDQGPTGNKKIPDQQELPYLPENIRLIYNLAKEVRDREEKSRIENSIFGIILYIEGTYAELLRR